jgi:hypothetical protein
MILWILHDLFTTVNLTVEYHVHYHYPRAPRTQAHRSIGYLNHNPQVLTESTVRLMYLCVYDSRDTSRQPPPSPSLSYSLTHVHRSIGYLNRNPKPLAESVVRQMYLRVYDLRDTSRQSSGPNLVVLRNPHCHTTPS